MSEPALAPKPFSAAAKFAARLPSVDLLRGIVMVVMTLDHVRDFLHTGTLNPRDVTETSLFLTRWVTHFCAPVFVFLAGVSAFLYARRAIRHRVAAGAAHRHVEPSLGNAGAAATVGDARGGGVRRDLSVFLLTRGLWLVLLELTVVRFAWLFGLDSPTVFALVLWALGWSMVALAALVHLPREAIAAIALVMIAGHNALDGIRAGALGDVGPVWIVLHEVGRIPITDESTLFVAYPLVPWIGVMAAGYLFAPVLLLDASVRRRRTLVLGLGACFAFVVVRGLNVYGDPARWTTQHDTLATLLSFLNCEKYPPSLSFLLMTLGPAIAVLPLLERARGRVAEIIATIGRVSLAYYVVHLFVIHAIAVVMAEMFFGDGRWLVGGSSFLAKPRGYGFGLPVVYAVWLLVVVVLTPACRWFAGLKRRRTDWWLSYL